MKKTVITSILALLLFHGSFLSLSVGDEQNKERDDVALEIMTVEVMVDQLEKMPRVTKDERNAWAQFFMDIEDKFSKIVTYEMRDNLNLWKLIGRWAAAEGLADKSPNADAPFFHIKRLRPNYQRDEELIRLMAKLNAIRLKKTLVLEIDGYRNFVYLFEECDTSNPKIQLSIGQAYAKFPNGLWTNRREAVKWYKRSAAAGNADAIGELGNAYIYGQLYGLEKNVETGVKLLNEAVMKGSASAAYTLGQHYRPSFYNKKGNWKKAIEMFHVAAKRGYHKAFATLAEEYVKVDNGTEALRWANGGDEPNVNNKIEHRRWEANRSMADVRGKCTYVRGEVYALGIGKIEQDLARAKKLFEESYRKGCSKAARALAAMYRLHFGVKANANNAILAEQWKNNAVKLLGGSDGAKRFIDREIRAFEKKLLEASMPYPEQKQ